MQSILKIKNFAIFEIFSKKIKNFLREKKKNFELKKKNYKEKKRKF